MGAHPKAPSMVEKQGRPVSLEALIDQNPAAILGVSVARAFDGRLPFLFKVLAAARPLSIQAHPDKPQAEAGFARENQMGISLDAPHRNYKDDNHKPECICALSEFNALCGFRRIDTIISYMDKLLPDDETTIRPTLQDALVHSRLQSFFKILMQLPADKADAVVNHAVANAGRLREADPVYKWIVRLHEEYPGDIGVLAPAFLNLITLTQGQAMFLPAGVLHAYLDGTGLELMANSDNVLRGGLTPKHVDVPELLKVLDFSEMVPVVLSPSAVGPCEHVYPTDAEEFVLSVIEVKPNQPYDGHYPENVAILLCTAGNGTLYVGGTGQDIPFQKGQSILIPATAGKYTLSGTAVVYKATVPD